MVTNIAERPWVEDPSLDTWLLSLPKPTGLYCVNDAVALHVLEHCHRLHLRVPEEISLLGTDNHPLLCESVRPHLSSIPQPLDAAGFRAAALLDEHLKRRTGRKKPPMVCERMEPGEVVQRQSTSLRAIPDPAIARAVEYLREQLLEGADIAGAARASGLNRRALERGFQRHLGISPGHFINEMKVEYAKHLLAETDLRMWEIAEACHMTQEHFSTFFHSATGQTPSAHRRKQQPKKS